MRDNNQRHSLRRLMPLFFVIFIDTLGYFIVLPVMIRIFMHGAGHLIPASTTLMHRDFLFSLVLALSPLAFILCSPVIGHLSDRFGRKKVLSYALVAATIGFALPIIGILTKSISWIFIGRAIAGASSSSQPIAQAGVTDFTTGKIRAFYLSMIGFSMTLGMVCGPLSGSYLSDSSLVHWFNITTPYWFALILSLLNIALILCFYSDTPQIKTHATHASLQQNTHKFIHLITQNKIWVLMLAFFFLEIAWSQYYQSSFLVLAQHFHYTTNHISIFAAYVGLWMCVGLSVVYKILTHYLSVDTIAKVSIFISALSLLLCNIPSITVQWVFMIPATIFIGTAYPSLLSAMSHRTSADHQGYVLGCASTFLGIAWMLTGLLSTPLAAAWYGSSTILASLSMALSFVIIRNFNGRQPPLNSIP